MSQWSHRLLTQADSEEAIVRFLLERTMDSSIPDTMDSYTETAVLLNARAGVPRCFHASTELNYVNISKNDFF